LFVNIITDEQKIAQTLGMNIAELTATKEENVTISRLVHESMYH
jgi:hypothetical protein